VLGAVSSPEVTVTTRRPGGQAAKLVEPILFFFSESSREIPSSVSHSGPINLDTGAHHNPKRYRSGVHRWKYRQRCVNRLAGTNLGWIYL
jgi:hypothetical protein